MIYFSFGVFPILLALAFAGIYDTFRFFSTGETIAKRVEKPNRTYFTFLMMYAVIGFILGCMVQAAYDYYKPCLLDGYPLIECFSK